MRVSSAAAVNDEWIAWPDVARMVGADIKHGSRWAEKHGIEYCQIPNEKNGRIYLKRQSVLQLRTPEPSGIQAPDTPANYVIDIKVTVSQELINAIFNRR